MEKLPGDVFQNPELPRLGHFSVSVSASMSSYQPSWPTGVLDMENFATKGVSSLGHTFRCFFLFKFGFFH